MQNKTNQTPNFQANELFACLTESCTIDQVINYYLGKSDQEPNYQVPENHSERYPCFVNYYNLMDCMPGNPNALYQIHDLEDLDEDYDGEYPLVIEIPTREAMYQLIMDISAAITKEIFNPAIIPSCTHEPGDDASGDIHEATTFLNILTSYDQQF